MRSINTLGRLVIPSSLIYADLSSRWAVKDNLADRGRHMALAGPGTHPP